jgi:hypothetical protein
MSTFMRVYLRFGRTFATIGARRAFRLRAVHIPLLSHSARRSLWRDASREQANPSYERQEVSDPSNRYPRSYRYPRSLAAADHQAPDPRVKQVGSWKRLRAIQYEGHPHGVAFMVAGAFALLTAPVVAFARISDNPKRRGAREILF